MAASKGKVSTNIRHSERSYKRNENFAYRILIKD